MHDPFIFNYEIKKWSDYIHLWISFFLLWIILLILGTNVYESDVRNPQKVIVCKAPTIMKIDMEISS